MKFRYQTYFLVLAMVIASSVCMADVPVMLKVRATPQLEALTAKYLLRLITEVRSEAGQKELAKSIDLVTASTFTTLPFSAKWLTASEVKPAL